MENETVQTEQGKSFDTKIRDILMDVVLHFDDENRREAENAFECYRIISKHFKINIRDLFNR